MQQIQVNDLDAKTLEAALACFWQFRARRVVRIHFGDNENAVALTLNRIGHDLFRAAFAVHLGGIDQSHAEIDP